MLSELFDKSNTPEQKASLLTQFTARYGVAEFDYKYGPRRSLQHKCVFCRRTDTNLIQCLGCHAIRYCSQEHQLAHHEHQDECTDIRSARKLLAERESTILTTLEADFGDGSTIPRNAFENRVGFFWDHQHTSLYLQTREYLAEALARVGSRDASSEAIWHRKEMLRLGHRDDMRVARLIPDALLDLGRDQECYDFVKWWVIKGGGSKVERVSFGEAAPSYLDSQDEDIYEDFDEFDLEHMAETQLGCLIALHLIKLRLLIDLRTVLSCRELQQKLPPELMDQVLGHALQSNASQSLYFKSRNQIRQLEAYLILQCQYLGGITCTANIFFWRDLFEADEHLKNSCHVSGDLMWQWNQANALYSKFIRVLWRTEGLLELLCSTRRFSYCKSQDDIRRLGHIGWEYSMRDNLATGPLNEGNTWGDREIWMYFADALAQKDGSVLSYI